MSTRTIKYIFMAAGLTLLGYRVATADDDISGTNVWIGASSGGSWANAANWRAESEAGWTVEELFKRNAVYDFRSLASGAVVTNDCQYGTVINGQPSTKLMMLRGLIFSGNEGDTWEFVVGDNNPYQVRFNKPCVMEIEGGTLNFNLSIFGGIYPYQQIVKYGSGTVNIMKPVEFWECDPSIAIYGGTVTLPNSMRSNNGAVKLYSNGRLSFPTGMMSIGKIYTDSAVDNTVLAIGDDATIRLACGHNVAGSGNTYHGDIVGGGTLKYCGGNSISFASGNKTEPLSFTGTLEHWNVDINFGTVENPQLANEAMTLKPCASGYCVFHADQRIKTLTGNAASGGVLIGNSTTLTVGPSDKEKLESSYYGRIGGSGSLTKDGANYTLNLGGNNTYQGETVIKAGTLALNRPNSKAHLAVHWNFEDEGDIGRDVAFGAMPLKSLDPKSTETPSLVDDGIVGKALHFSSTSKVEGYKLTLDRENSDPDSVLPIGNAPTSSSFTCSFWMRPDGNGCGAYPNFIHLAPRTDDTAGLSWNNDFYFGSVDTAWGTDNAKAPAFTRFGMYFHGWSVSGGSRCVYTDMNEGESLTDGTWHHIVGTYDSVTTEAILYIDGKERARKTLGFSATVPSNCEIQIGNFSGDANHKYAGDLDEIEIYRAVWTAEQVKNTYEAMGRTGSSKLPAPLAHWTFDEADGMNYADFGTLGIPMTTVNSNGTGLEMNKIEVIDKTGLHTIKAVATAAEGPTGNYTNYAALRLAAGGGEKLKQALPMGTSFTISARTGRCAGDPFLIVGDGTDAGSIRLTHQEAPRVTRWLAGNNQAHGGNDSITWMGANSWEANWVHMTIVYDADEGRIRYYFDGNEIEKEVRSLNDINFIDVVFGAGVRDSTTGEISKWQYSQWSNVQIDDLAIWNVALTPEQIREHLRNVVGVASKESVLPATSPVTIEEGARLLVRTGSQTAKSVNGAGKIEIFGGASFAADSWDGFTGTIAGVGELIMNGSARIGEGATIATPVTISSIKVDAKAENNLPMVTNVKRVKIADTGSFTIENVNRQPYKKRYELARNIEECELPKETSGWKLYPELPAIKFEFEFSNGSIWLKTGNVGMTVRLL